MALTVPLSDIRVDWFRVLVDIQAEGYSMYAISHFTRIPKTTLLGYKQGAQPIYNTGLTLIRCWAEATGKTPDKVPTVSRYSFKA